MMDAVKNNHKKMDVVRWNSAKINQPQLNSLNPSSQVFSQSKDYVAHQFLKNREQVSDRYFVYLDSQENSEEKIKQKSARPRQNKEGALKECEEKLKMVINQKDKVINSYIEKMNQIEQGIKEMVEDYDQKLMKQKQINQSLEKELQIARNAGNSNTKPYEIQESLRVDHPEELYTLKGAQNEKKSKYQKIDKKKEKYFYDGLPQQKQSQPVGCCGWRSICLKSQKIEKTPKSTEFSHKDKK